MIGAAGCWLCSGDGARAIFCGKTLLWLNKREVQCRESGRGREKCGGLTRVALTVILKARRIVALDLCYLLRIYRLGAGSRWRPVEHVHGRREERTEA